MEEKPFDTSAVRFGLSDLYRCDSLKDGPRFDSVRQSEEEGICILLSAEAMFAFTYHSTTRPAEPSNFIDEASLVNYRIN